jgi:hypothetical protein
MLFEYRGGNPERYVKYTETAVKVARHPEPQVWRGPGMILKWQPSTQNVTQLARRRFYGR